MGQSTGLTLLWSVHGSSECGPFPAVMFGAFGHSFPVDLFQVDEPVIILDVMRGYSFGCFPVAIHLGNVSLESEIALVPQSPSKVSRESSR